jgi:hypothetical protein
MHHFGNDEHHGYTEVPGSANMPVLTIACALGRHVHGVDRTGAIAEDRLAASARAGNLRDRTGEWAPPLEIDANAGPGTC